MKIALDTEFYEDGKTIELISIGLAREDGETYYAEVIGASELATSSDWLTENVYPYLTGPRKSKAQIAYEIREFADLDPEFWAWFASYDWIALCQLYGRMIDLPPTWPQFCRDFRQTSFGYGKVIKHELDVDGPQHHALSDAKWLMRAMQEYEAKTKQRIHEKTLHMEDRIRMLLPNEVVSYKELRKHFEGFRD